MTAETLAMLAGAVLSLAFSYVPGLSAWFGNLEGTYKRLVMAGLLLLVAVGVAGLACAGFGPDFNLGITCDRAGLVGLFQAFMLALVANQATYSITK